MAPLQIAAFVFTGVNDIDMRSSQCEVSSSIWCGAGARWELWCYGHRRVKS